MMGVRITRAKKPEQLCVLLRTSVKEDDKNDLIIPVADPKVFVAVLKMKVQNNFHIVNL